jgi:hypothetical protein
MHFHLPKPMHGWREFVGEVGIIVVGVLIALGAEQVVEEIHDRRVADETRQAIREEFNDDLSAISLRGEAEPCIQRRLGEVRQILLGWQKDGRFVTPKWVAQTPQIDVALTRYEAAVSAGRLSLLPSSEQYQIGSIASGIRRFDEIQQAERPVWGRLRALQAGGEALSATDRTMMLEALQDAAMFDYQARIAVRQLLPFAKDAGFEPDFAQFKQIVGRVWAGGRFTPSICTPIDTPVDEANRTQVTPLPL